MRFGKDATRNPVTRRCRHATVRLARCPKPEAVRRDAVDDELLFGERHDVHVRDQLIRLEQVAERLVRARDGQPADQDFAVSQVQVQILNLDFGTEHLGPDFLRLAPRDRVGEQPP